MTNTQFAELTLDGDTLMIRVPGCTCEGPPDVPGAGHRDWCGWEPLTTLVELDRLVPSLPVRLVRDFHEKFGLPIDDTTRASDDLRISLIREEAKELTDAIESGDRAAIAKEAADLLIAVHGTGITMGIDLDAAVRLVHGSNMTKLDENGRPAVSLTGKVLKGWNYEPPDMFAVAYPMSWIERLLDSHACGCPSHVVIDNQERCSHCHAHPADSCASSCPIGQLDDIQARDDCPEPIREMIISGKGK